jgi:hypothetical protein
VKHPRPIGSAATKYAFSVYLHPVNTGQKKENDTMTTITKAAFGLVLILATASGALAAGHKSTEQRSAPRETYPVVNDAVHVPFPQLESGN